MTARPLQRRVGQQSTGLDPAAKASFERRLRLERRVLDSFHVYRKP